MIWHSILIEPEKSHVSSVSLYNGLILNFLPLCAGAGFCCLFFDAPAAVLSVLYKGLFLCCFLGSAALADLLVDAVSDSVSQFLGEAYIGFASGLDFGSGGGCTVLGIGGSGRSVIFLGLLVDCVRCLLTVKGSA